jgi:Xaa-Pro aminopeptidase
MKRISSLLLLVNLIFCFGAFAQDNLPTDYLTKEFHAGRRDALRKIMPDNAVFVVMAYPVRNFSNDVDYLYHQNPDMYYFSGYKEPHSLLLIFKEEQKGTDGTTFKEILFVQKKNALAEQWTGRRLGTEGAKQQLGFAYALNGEEFKHTSIDFSKFDKIIFDRFPDDLGNDNRDQADLYDLIQQFKNLAKVPAEMGKDAKYDTRLFRELTGKLREIKTPEEMDLIRKAVEISCQGQNEVMKTVHPGMGELEIQGLHEFIHKKYGAEYVGYGSIVGAGANGCILHYMENNKTKIGNELLLMDVGAEYHGYTADVTRTIPANGKFSSEQKIIYNLVYEAQEAAFKILKDGAKFSDASKAARDVIAEGLLKLGIISEKSQVGKYYPHGLGHHIGLDVHDRSFSQVLKKDMVITIEPGIYIPPNSDCDKKWWSIAVRIEDDALITQDGFELLSVFAPRKVEEIEKKIAEKSPLDNFTVPKLKSTEKKAF